MTSGHESGHQVHKGSLELVVGKEHHPEGAQHGSLPELGADALHDLHEFGGVGLSAPRDFTEQIHELPNLFHGQRGDMTMVIMARLRIVNIVIKPLGGVVKPRSLVRIPVISRSLVGMPMKPRPLVGIPVKSRSVVGMPMKPRSLVRIPLKSRSVVGGPVKFRFVVGITVEIRFVVWVSMKIRFVMGMPAKPRFGVGVIVIGLAVMGGGEKLRGVPGMIKGIGAGLWAPGALPIFPVVVFFHLFLLVFSVP